jgi:hypothetical protein
MSCALEPNEHHAKAACPALPANHRAASPRAPLARKLIHEVMLVLPEQGDQVSRVGATGDLPG